MPFKKVDISEEIKRKMESDENFKKAYNEVQEEYELIKYLIKVRKEKHLTQSDVAKRSGLTQQMVSRIEKLGYRPNLLNFIKYVNALDLQIKFEEKRNNKNFTGSLV